MVSRIITSVDIVLFTLLEDGLAVGLLRRGVQPHKGKFALPGATIDTDIDADALGAAHRVLAERAHVQVPYLEQLATFADATRDARGWSISISYFALISAQQLVSQLSPDNFKFTLVSEITELPFDHKRILDAGVTRLCSKSSYSTLPCHFLGESFTLSELQETYSRLTGERLDKSSFRRKIMNAGFVEPTGEIAYRRGAPADLYKLKEGMEATVFARSF